MIVPSPEVEQYLVNFSPPIRERLEILRFIIGQLAPDAVEGFAYGLVAYKLNNKPLVYFGGFKKHIGLYATPTGHEPFKEQLSSYKQGRGSVQFPHNLPLPIHLISEMISFRISNFREKDPVKESI